MFGELFTLFFLLFLGSVAGLLGGLVFLFKKKWARALSRHAIPLAAGVLLSVSFLDLLPEGVESIGNQAFVIVLAVFVLFFLIERFFFHLHHHEEEDSPVKSAVPLVIFGDTIHNFLDGVAIAASYLVEPKLGLVVAVATFLHETPHEIADFGILLSAGWTRKKALVFNFLSALSTFPGGILTLLLAGRVDSTGVQGALLAVAAGLFLYVAATDFIPAVQDDHRRSSWQQVAFFILGVLAVAAFGIFIPESG